jgi:dTDP-4-dehydrorhamnose reductase
MVVMSREDLDLAGEASRVREACLREKPDFIVNAAAYTDVDRAESEAGIARAINCEAPGILAEAAKALGALLIHYSTDYVFNGEKREPYCEMDQPDPLNIYGRTKLEGEQAIRSVGNAYLILRTSWLYSMRRPSFPIKVLKWARSQGVMRVVEDQVGSPTWARMLANTTAMLISRYSKGQLVERSGVYHLAGHGRAGRYEWAKAIVALDPRPEEQLVREILPAPSSEFPTVAKRPSNSALNCQLFEKTFGLRMPQWDLALKWAMEEVGVAE